jgi:hypothetical protein
MRTSHLVIVCCLAALALAAAVQLADLFMAVHVFTWLWYGPRSSMAPAAFALVVPLLVAVPAGVFFGLLPLGRAWGAALVVASPAALLEVLSLYFVAARGDSRAWVYWLEAGALLFAFTVAAAVSARVVSAWPKRRRTIAGAVGYSGTVIVVAALALLAYRGMAS